MTRAVGLLAATLLLASCASPADPGAAGEGGPTDPGSGSSAATPAGPSGSPSTTPDGPSATPAPGAGPAGTVVTTAVSDYGPMLFDATGQAIYLFDRERSTRPQCYGPCAEAWPPVLTSGAPRPRGAAVADLLGTVRRRDGTTQVTYAGHPLYFYAHEGKHQVLCHDVREFGGLWLVVTPRGRPAPS